ncbi:MAG: caspase family protein [Acidimicrobiia bacterium]
MRASSSPPVGAYSAAGDTVITPPPAVFDAPAAPTAPPPPGLGAAPPTVRARGGVWAVVVGIDDYPGSRSDLRAAVNDARDVDAALAQYGVPAEHRLLIVDRQASAATITAALDWLVARAGPGSTAVFFYAGHVRKLDRDSETMVGADGGLVRDHDLARHLAGLEASRTWLAIAGCYGGGFVEALGPGRILTGASDADSLAYENAAYGRSYLVEFMVRRAMLEGRAGGSIEASFAWAVDTLRRERPDRLPVQYDEADGELRLGNPPAPRPQPAPEPSEQAPAPTEPDPAPDDRHEDCVLRIGTLVGCGDRR